MKKKFSATHSRISKIPNNVQNRDSKAWKSLCEYIDYVAENELDEFSPREYLGDELFAEIYTLPESIAQLKKVKKMGLYGSKLKRIPPEIGEMSMLEYFDVYTSYDLYWFPYEITKCQNLIDSRISTRVLYGNYKNRMGFPRLHHNPIRYHSDTVKCSICEKELSYDQTNQLWITLRVGTDNIPLLANLCSAECETHLPQPPKGYVQSPHKGGADLEQPEPSFNEPGGVTMTLQELHALIEEEGEEELKPIKLVRKIWEK